MGLEISRITDCVSWRTVVGMEYSTVFDKCPSPVNWVEPHFVQTSAHATCICACCMCNECLMEARAGVEPTYTDLQSGA
jgi:hypothetical protein